MPFATGCTLLEDLTLATLLGIGLAPFLTAAIAECGDCKALAIDKGAAFVAGYGCALNGRGTRLRRSAA